MSEQLSNVQKLEVDKRVKAAKEEFDKNLITYDKLAQFTGFQTELIKVMHTTVAKGTTVSELAYFLTFCKSVGLNPLNKEIWCYKNTKDEVIIFTGRDGFLKKNKENPDYLGMKHAVVCEYDDFLIDMVEGKVVKHEVTVNRGKVIGAYCYVYVAGKKDTFVYIDFDEFDLKQAKWKSSPKMMIEKCAQSLALKEAAGITGLQAEEAGVVVNGKVHFKEAEVEVVNKEDERLELLIQNAKSPEALEKLLKDCKTPEQMLAYDNRMEVLKNVESK